jgi:hypothetical protein
MSDVTNMHPYMQAGFAGMAFLLLSAVIGMAWYALRSMVRISDENNQASLASNAVIAANTAALLRVADVIDETKSLSIEIKDQQLRSVCMLPEEVKDRIKPIIRDYYLQTESYKAERAQAAKTEIRATMAIDPA